MTFHYDFSVSDRVKQAIEHVMARIPAEEREQIENRFITVKAADLASVGMLANVQYGAGGGTHAELEIDERPMIDDDAVLRACVAHELAHIRLRHDKKHYQDMHSGMSLDTVQFKKRGRETEVRWCLSDRWGMAGYVETLYRFQYNQTVKSLQAGLSGPQPAAHDESQRRRIGRGRMLSELLKGSLQYTLHAVGSAFVSQFYGQGLPNDEEVWNLSIIDTFDDYIVVRSDRLSPDEFYQVSYQRIGQTFVFVSTDEWQIVELTYQPTSSTTT